MDPDFLKTMEDVKALLRYVWQTENSFTVPVSGTGSAAWEAAVANLTEPGDKHLICNNGYFGERALDLHGRYTDNICEVTKPYGEVFTKEDIEQALQQHKPQVPGWDLRGVAISLPHAYQRHKRDRIMHP